MTAPMTRTRRAAVAVSVILVLASVAQVGVTLASLAGSTWETTTSDIAVSGHQVSLRTGSSDVDVRPSADAGLHLERHVRYGLRKPQVSQRRTADGIVISGDCSWPDAVCSVHYVLFVPPSLDVSVSVGSGDIDVRDVPRTVGLETGSGDLTARGLRGSAFTARTGSGDMHLEFQVAPDNVDARTGSGDIKVLLPPQVAYDVRTEVGSGDTHVSVTRSDASPHHLTLKAGSGSISVAPGR